jgi:hypothetical protein
MKNYLPGIFAIVLAIGLSSFKQYDDRLSVLPERITVANVSSSLTYTNTIISCEGLSEGPCILDLTMINPVYWVTDEESFINYLITQFPSASIRVAEVNRITIEWKN